MGNTIHRLSDADFTAFTYNQIFTSEAADMTLNGTDITITPPMKLDIVVTSCESATPDNIFLVGIRTYYSGPASVDILTGKPILNG